jgi:hypothetical protein
MTSLPARKPVPVPVSASIKAAAATLNELALQLADLILWLETERGELPDEAVLSYVYEAVTVEIRHRRRTQELSRSLAAIERETAGGGVRPPAVTRPALPYLGPRAPAQAVTPGSDGKADPEDAFLRTLVAEGAPVHLRCLDGYEVASGILRGVSASALLVDTLDGPELFLKRNVISIVRS